MQPPTPASPARDRTAAAPVPAAVPSFWARFGPPQLGALAVVLAVALIGLRPPGDPDLWWHLRAGDWILDHGRLPGTDPFSATAAGDRWVAHEWLGEVIFTGAYRAFGYDGIVVLRALGALLLTGGLALVAFRRTSPYRALAVSFLGAAATAAGWGERPQLFSFVLLVPVSVLLADVLRGRDRRLWPLVPLTWLWANLHGLFAVAIGLTFLVALGIVLDGGRPALRRCLRLCGVGAAMTVAAALTPNGPRLLLAPLHVREYARFVSEWEAPGVRSVYGSAFLLLLLVTLAGWARSRRAVPRSQLLWVAVATVIGFTYIRTVAVGAVLLVPFAAEAASYLGRPSSPPRRTGPARLNAALAGLLLLAATLGGTAALVVNPDLPANTPWAATRAVLATPGPRRVLNEYALGGWLIWAAPGAPPAIDGRTEIYPVAYVARYLDALSLRGDWRALVAAVDPTVAWLHRETPLATGLRDLLGWRVVYADDDSLVLVPPR